MIANVELPGAYVLTGRAIYTMNPAQPRAEAVGVLDGRIAAVGSVAQATAALPDGAPVIDVGDRMVLPGFTDSHIHVGYLARKWNAVDLDGCHSLEEALRRVARFVSAKPGEPTDWVDGHGWAAGGWQARPTAAALDSVTGNRPAALSAKDGHALWVNSAALRAAGIDEDTEDPPGGVIERDPATGRPTGVLYEAATRLVLDVMPDLSVDQLAAAIQAGLPRLHAQGITAVHCPELVSDWRAYWMLRQRGQLTARVTFLPRAEQLEHLLALGLETGFGDEWLRLGQLKFFADGTLGSRTAAMLEPFEGEPDNVGVLVCGGEELRDMVARAAGHGIASAIHAIGDRGVREALDAIEYARTVVERERKPPSELRHRIEHAQLVHPLDMDRLARLGVTASMQPAHGAVDRPNALRYWGARVAYASPYRSLIRRGVVLAFGSDAPFGLDLRDMSFSVLAGVYAATTRRWPGDAQDGTTPPDDYAPDEVLRLEEALAAYTTGPAVAGGEEAWRGRLAPGLCADLVVLEEDLFDVSPADVPHVPVVLTIAGGRIVHRRDS